MSRGITNFDRLRLTGDSTGETIFQATHGVSKIHNRPTTDGYALEVKSEPTSVSGTHFGIETTVDHKPSTVTSALGSTGVGGISRLAATYTMTGGSLVGLYGQACNLGTINGAGAFIAGLYGLIEDGGTYTAVGHLASAWLDSHLDQAVSAGNTELLYMTNNGDTTLAQAIYLRPGNKITNLLTIDTASGMVGAKVNGDYTFTATRKIKVNVGGDNGVGGETGYIVVDIS
jgi:hypothetical protein